MGRDFGFIALTLPGLPDAATPAAACRAGAWGALNLEGCSGPRADAALRGLSVCDRRRLGIRIGPDWDAGRRAIDRFDGDLGLIISDARMAARHFRRFRDRADRVLVEVTCEDDARIAEQCGADGLIARGNEVGGNVGEETTFVLIQRLLDRGELPVWAHGGIGIRTAAACSVAGAAGVVLDAQLALARESALGPNARDVISGMDGSETVVVQDHDGNRYRLFKRPDLEPLARFQERAASTTVDPAEFAARIGWRSPQAGIWPLGQDAALARPLAKRFVSVGGIIAGLREGVDRHLAAAKHCRPLGEGAPLADSHRTRYPIAQGPMTRVSDQPEFAARVAQGGALPFLALALLRGAKIDALMRRTRDLLGDRPWGVGILGFVPDDLRQEQLAAVQPFRPPYALIAGGRPEQAMDLERAGTKTYLHVPSPGLLELFLDRGARRFVFEGRECGGHVGPRSSFVLWETMLDVLAKRGDLDGAEYHVLFAGGIHDSRSAAMVATLAGPLAGRGVRVGALLGTAYVFTADAVETGAIVPTFQRVALDCDATTLLETGPGHATRCAPTAFAEFFAKERERLRGDGAPVAASREALERLNLGRLRIATKGLRRASSPNESDAALELTEVSEDEQRSNGMYMLGQVAGLRRSTCTVDELHREISLGSSERLEGVETLSARARRPRRPRASDVAIVGMASILPGAPDLNTYWHNILARIDAISEVPPDRWDPERYFDPDPGARDKVYSKWGGFIDEVLFDPTRYGMPPSSIPSIEPMQLLTLELMRAAIDDAGYSERSFPRDRTAVVLGVGGGVADLGQQYAIRSGLPMLFDGEPVPGQDRLPEWTEDSFAGILLNVVAGRVANRFDLHGPNFTVDAACASSLAAVHLGVRELEAGESDVALVGGADTVQNPFGYLCFSKTQALSPRGRCRTFDTEADGIVISEGLAALVLKRLGDAERDGDRIYAVIKSICGASDGRAKGLTAPHPDGQKLALRRAYEKAGISPASVGLVEAHGTGTVAGDRAEVETLNSVFADAGASPHGCAIGSVKSMIGHTKCTAGVAGLIKAALALHDKALPPTLNVERPNPALATDDSPFYVNTEPRPWLAKPEDEPRRAAISAFGFGGTNFHAVLEEHPGPSASTAACGRPPAELLVLSADSRQALEDRLGRIDHALEAGAQPPLGDLAWSLWAEWSPAHPCRLAVVTTSLDDLRQKLDSAKRILGAQGESRGNDIYFSDESPETDGKIAFLFPGQGSQYPGMFRELAVYFGEVREQFELADRVLADCFPDALSSYVLPPPAFDPERSRAQAQELQRTNIAQPALGVTATGAVRLLREFGIHPDLGAGHSYGEYAALWAAGVFDDVTLLSLSEARGRSIVEAAEEDLGTMAAVAAGAEELTAALGDLDGVWLANLNAPGQTVLSGTARGIAAATERLTAAGVAVQPLPVACGFHSPLVAPAGNRLRTVLEQTELKPAAFEIFSNTTAGPYPSDPDAIRALLAEHLTNPVRFDAEVEAMYEAGARVFIEAGPRGVLTGLVSQILGQRRHVSVALDGRGRPGYVSLLRGLARLAAAGVAVDPDRLFVGRGPRRIDLGALDRERRDPSPTAWRVSGGRAEPVGGAPASELDEPSPATASTPAVAPAKPLHREMPAPALPSEPGVKAPAPFAQFQDLMDRFLETQERVMLAYLNGNGSAAARPDIAGLVEQGSRPNAAGEPPAAEESSESAAEDPAPQVAENGRPFRGPGRDEILDRLLSLVSERTGYPREMLDPELDIESELGIDSIKRVEILGALRQDWLGDGAGDIEELVGLKTLAAVADAACELVGAKTGEAAPAPATASSNSTERPSSSGAVPRFVLEAIDVPEPEPVEELAGRRVLITMADGRLSRRVADELAGRDAQTRLVPRSSLENPADAERLIETARAEGEVPDAILHLAPFEMASDTRLATGPELRARLRIELDALAQLARGFAGEMLAAADRGEAIAVMAVTGMGGALASDEGAATASPTNGAVAGFVKALAEEWPKARCRVLDLPIEADPDVLSGAVIAELFAADPEVEVGRKDGRRLGLRARPAPLADPGLPGLVDSDSVIVFTGGARGIGSEVALELARTYRPTLVLIGRSSLPASESAATTDLDDARALKAALISGAEADGRTPRPREIEAEYRRLLADREIRTTLRQAEAAGAKVRYVQVDVRDQGALERALDQIHSEHGRVDGVIHAAGVIDDALLTDKSPASFARVLETKALSAAALADRLESSSPRFLAFFSSVSGRFGNAGQTDYAAANEFLNKLALRLDRTWPGRVFSIDWGPWRRGMATPELQRRFEERGVTPISPQHGRRAFIEELQRGRKGEAEVILGDGPWASRLSDARPPRRRLGLLGGSTVQRENGRVVASCELDPDREPLLSDHRLDSRPVLPAAAALELVAEAAASGRPDREVIAVRDFRVLRGITADDGVLRVQAIAEDRPVEDEVLPVDVSLAAGDPGSPNYRGQVLMSTDVPEPPAVTELVAPSGLEPPAMSVEEAYRRWLFQGPHFRRIQSIAGIGADGVEAVLASRDGDAAREWLIDPVAIDCGFQLAILWARANYDMTPLPAGLRTLRRFAPLAGDRLRCLFLARSDNGGHSIDSDIALIDGRDRVLVVLEGMEFACSRSLNRLAEEQVAVGA